MPLLTPAISPLGFPLPQHAQILDGFAPECGECLIAAASTFLARVACLPKQGEHVSNAGQFLEIEVISIP